jgi:hypothetical protein
MGGDEEFPKRFLVGKKNSYLLPGGQAQVITNIKVGTKL